MAQQPTPSFAETWAKYAPRQRPAAAPKKPDFSGVKFAQPAKPVDPISWLLDIVSRPLRTVTESADTDLDIAARSKDLHDTFARGDVLGALGIVGQNAADKITAPVRGLLSTNPDDQPYTSDLIEKTSDTFGELHDPRYQDVQDNVNPIVKGIGGFIGDVALDPLTYTPGAAIAAVGKGLARTGKAASAGVKGAVEKVRAPKTVEEPIDEVLAQADVAVEEASVLQPGPLDTSNMPLPRADLPVGGATAVERVMGPTTPERGAFGQPKAAQQAIPEPASAQVLADPKIQGAQDYLKNLLNPDAAEEAMSAARAVANTVPQKLDKIGWLKKWAGEEKEITWQVPDKGISTTVTPSMIAQNPRKWLNPDNPATLPIRKGVAANWKAYEAEHASLLAGAKEGVANDLPVEIVAGDRFSRFQRKLADEASREDAEFALGSHLFSYLQRSTRPDTFEKSIKAVEDMLQRGSKLDKIQSTNRASLALRAIMGTTDVDVIGTNIARRGQQINAASKVADRLGAKSQKIVRDAIRENPIGHLLTREERAAKNRNAKAAIAAREADRVAQEVKTTRIAEAVGQRERIMTYLPAVVRRQLDHGFKYRTDKGIARSSEYTGVGWGINDKMLNGYFQWDLAQRAMDYWIEAAKAPAPGPRGGKASFPNGEARAKFIRDGFMEDMLVIERMLDDEGYQMWLGRSAEDAVPMSLTQAYRILEEANPDFLKYVFNASTRVPTTNLIEAIKATVSSKGATVDDLKRILSDTRKDSREGLIVNPLNSAKNAAYGFLPNTRKEPFETFFKRMQKSAKGKNYSYRPNKGKTGVFKVYQADTLRDELAETVARASEDLRETVADNAARLGNRYEEEAFDLTQEEVGALLALVDDPSRLGTALDAIAQHTDDLDALGEWGGATVDGVVRAKAQVTDSIDKAILGNATHLSTAAKQAERATSSTAGGTTKQLDAAGANARKRPQQKAGDEAIRAEEEAGNLGKTDPLDSDSVQRAIDLASENRRLGVEDASWDASAKAYAEVNSRVGRIFDPTLRTLKASYGQEHLYQVWHSFRNGSAARTAKVAKDLSQAAKKYGGPISADIHTPIIKSAWDDWRAGRVSTDPRVAEAQGFIKTFMDGKFSGADGSLNSYTFLRTPAGIEAINGSLRNVGMKEDFLFDLDAARTTAKENGTNALREVMDQVRTWDTDDPIDTLQRLYAAAEQVATDAGVVQGSTKWMLDRGLASYSPKKGYTKIHFSEDNRYGAMLDEDLYWDPEIAREWSIMDAVSRESRMFDTKTGFGNFVHNYFDTIQGAWKYAITLPRPGHHIRNMIGDFSMTWVAEGARHFRKSNKDAWKVLNARGNYTDLDVSKALEHYGEKNMPRNGAVLHRGRKGFDDLTLDQVTDAMYSHGLLNSYQGLEDLLDVANPFAPERAAKFKSVVDTVFLRGTAIERGAASISEGRDHLARAQHFLQYVYKGMDDGRFGGDFEELFRNAAFQVKKHHPDGSMLTPFEAKYLRRVIPFYSWLRGALPAIVEGAVLHPGRTAVFPKASYNLAISMGINPDSLSEPFPEDQLFPSFLTEQVLGPQFEAGGKYFGINPGIASIDVANMMLADPVRGIAGSMSPLLRVGPELLSGSSWATGSKIKDTSDYLDAMIPGVNYLSNVSGVSTTGSAVSLLTQGTLDPQAQVAAGNKTDADKGLSALNWLLGLNVQNMSKPNFINYAEIEKRNAEGGPSAKF